ncbi:MAG: 6-carboxytetrahydropterin synthase [Xanthomonadales bacterium]|nr:6-carboxytetrahydropterin synthase [Xanthomonadales bacterium]
MALYRSSKTFRGFPCAHRKWRHDGHCAWVHGYSREFIVWFQSTERDENGFVMDFGALGEVRRWLEDRFDHTLLLDTDDPMLDRFRELERDGACKLTVLDDVGMEGTARFVYEYLNQWVGERTNGRVSVYSVECRENEKNSGLFIASDSS